MNMNKITHPSKHNNTLFCNLGKGIINIQINNFLMYCHIMILHGIMRRRMSRGYMLMAESQNVEWKESCEMNISNGSVVLQMLRAGKSILAQMITAK